MSDDLQDIVVPAASAVLTADQAFHGPHIPPQQQILLYSASEWEGLVHEWAHYCLKTLYAQVQRFTGAGDRGIDIAGFTDANKLQGVWDNYQCKHYDHALHPGDVWPESANCSGTHSISNSRFHAATISLRRVGSALASMDICPMRLS
jgi:hypothetical protein